jgi:hypothetical protein
MQEDIFPRLYAIALCLTCPASFAKALMYAIIVDHRRALAIAVV